MACCCCCSSALFIFCFCASLSMLGSTDSNPYSIQFSLGSVYRGTETIMSQNGTFAAGLFSPPPGSNRFYFGIWFAGLQPKTVVWVANRNVPVSAAAEYGFSAEGKLEVREEGGKVAWSTSEIRGGNVRGAVLEETGNLLLVGGANGSVVIWQSFDFPGNTMLPHMKIRMGQNLTSWRSAGDPAEGLYSVQLLPSMEFVFMWDNRTQYWSTGAWNGHGFAGIPDMVNNTYISFFFDETGFSWSLAPQVNFISRSIIDTDGEFKQFAWNLTVPGWTFFWSEPQDQCLVFGLCGQNSLCRTSVQPSCSCPTGFLPSHAQDWASGTWSAGCLPEKPPKCGSGAFLPLANFAFQAGHPWIAIGVASNADCAAVCLRNCSCAAYNYVEGVCELLSEPLLNGRSSPDITGTVYMKVGEFPATAVSRRRRKEVMALAGAGAAFALLLGVGIGICVLKAKVRGTPEGFPGVQMIDWFSYAQLQSATRNFSDRLGSGGFGAVFKGSLGVDATPVAVKQLLRHRRGWEHGEKQFRMEVSSLGSIQHVNLVRLRGFCSEKTHRMLVYDFMPNGSLDTYLNNSRPSLGSVKDPKRTFLDWATRYQIAMGTARGIAYLHDGCRQSIFHCDIKPENILLDADYTAKVSDFGLAKLVGREFSSVLTTIRGTRGYLAPEWISGMPITSKADVYSYGMTLLELISGRRNLSYGNSTVVLSGDDHHRRFFPVWAALCIVEEKDLVANLADTRLAGQVDVEQLRRAAYTAVWCIQEQEAARPTMQRVVHMLEGSLDISPPPVPESLRALVLEEDPYSQNYHHCKQLGFENSSSV